MTSPHLLVLAEGDPESYRANSGTVRSLVDGLRGQGCRVTTADVDLKGVARLAAAASSISRRRDRWRVRFHTSALAFALRSRNARAAITAHPDVDAIVQYGSTFSARGGRTVPTYAYMDSNMHMARDAGVSWAAVLTPAEVTKVIAREQSVYESLSGIFTFSDHARHSFITDLGLPEHKVLTVRAAPNLATESAAIHRGRTERAPVILFVGVEFVRKGGMIMLEAFRRVRETIPEARLIVVGPRDLQLNEPGVAVVGNLQKDRASDAARLAECFRDAAAFCLPTLYEPFGIAILEAMHFALPCIATDGWAIPEMIVNGETGFLVRPGDAGALAARLLQLLLQPTLASDMGAAGARRAAALFSWDAVCATMLERMHHDMRTSAGG